MTSSRTDRPAPRAAELLAPAGDPESAFAAFEYGADAVYLGLRQFSARAEAVNLTPAELGEIVAFARAARPARRVFVTVNTLVLNRELRDLVRMLAVLAETGVDAVIVQDLGVARVVQQHFPELALHASTQMDVHSLSGVRAAAALGFRRVTLARELTLAEIRDIARESPIEVEVFIHGALCYSYSGLCLFSSQMRGRSGNRGRCSYPCRDAFRLDPRDAEDTEPAPPKGAAPVFPFSMKDLATPSHVRDLARAGVASLKIEGRKKSPLYVAAVTGLYRAILDGRESPAQIAARQADVRTIFARPWTPLYLGSARNRDVVDRDTVGHRGAPAGAVESVADARGRPSRLRVRLTRAIERHDGLQIDIPGQGKPFGFPVTRFRIVEPRAPSPGTPVFEARAGAMIEVDIPADHPDVRRGFPVYCSSSQAVKQRYRWNRPRPGTFRIRQPMEVVLRLDEAAVEASATVRGPGPDNQPAVATQRADGPFPAARDPAAMEAAARTAFEKLGDSRLGLGSLTVINPGTRFVPASVLNDLRRGLVRAMEEDLAAALDVRATAAERIVCAAPDAPGPAPAAETWAIKTDRFAHLAALDADDRAGLRELVIDISEEPLATLKSELPRLAGELGMERIRLALPMIARNTEEPPLRAAIDWCREAGFRRWEAANVSAWPLLGAPIEDLSGDWSLYVLNRMAALQLREMGATQFTFSPEDGFENMRALLAEFGSHACVVIYQDTPLFISESCVRANLDARCSGQSRCGAGDLLLTSDSGERLRVVSRRCRSITLGRSPFCLAARLPELRRAGASTFRADFVFRRYAPEEVAAIWRAVRAGRNPGTVRTGNFQRGFSE